MGCFDAGVHAPSANYDEVWMDLKRMEWVTSFSHRDTLAQYQYSSCNSLADIEKFASCDDLTLLRFFKDGIPCSCLDEKYEEANSKSSLVEFGEEEEVHTEYELNYPAIQEGMRSHEIMRKIALVELTFETDMLSQYGLPNSYVPHMQIDAATRETECMHKYLSPLRLPPHEFALTAQFLKKFTCEYNAVS
eukprot:scaffold5207_cov84-Skeletonema_marinoi.AAC.6